jgi:hypothetical protein
MIFRDLGPRTFSTTTQEKGTCSAKTIAVSIVGTPVSGSVTVTGCRRKSKQTFGTNGRILACVPLDHELKLIDIDADDSELMAAVLAVLPDSRAKEAWRKKGSVLSIAARSRKATRSFRGDSLADCACRYRGTRGRPGTKAGYQRPYTRNAAIDGGCVYRKPYLS